MKWGNLMRRGLGLKSVFRPYLQINFNSNFVTTYVIFRLREAKERSEDPQRVNADDDKKSIPSFKRSTTLFEDHHGSFSTFTF